MHYYQFNIGDYASHAGYLTPMEDLAYRRLLDRYYLNECPLTNDIKKLARLINLRGEEDAIQQVLEDFFEPSDEGWRNKRADEEIASYRSKGDTARENGRKGGRPKKKKADENPEETQSVSGEKPKETQSVSNQNPEETGSKANQEPETNNQETNKTSCPEPGVSEPNEPPVIEFPTNRSGELYPITVRDIRHWQEDFPAVDILAQLRKMRSWLDANASRRKTKKGMKRFIVNWLSKEQDKGGVAPRASPQQSHSPMDQLTNTDWAKDLVPDLDNPPIDAEVV